MEVERIDFQDNWNNKLLCDVFSTIRPATKKYDPKKRFAVYLRERFYCYADIIYFEKTSLQELINKKIHLIDTGKEEKEFIELMESFYNKKTWWKGKDSEVIILYFKKIIQTNLFDTNL